MKIAINENERCVLCGCKLNESNSHDATPLATEPCCSVCFTSEVLPQREAYEEAMYEYETEEEARYEADELTAAYFDLDVEVL